MSFAERLLVSLCLGILCISAGGVLASAADIDYPPVIRTAFAALGITWGLYLPLGEDE